MRAKEEIKESIRGNLPIVFGKVDPVDPKAFRERFSAAVDYLLAISEPFLKPETIRYQSILLYVTLIFLSLSLLRIGKVKIGEDVVSVDHRLLVVYTLFIVGVAAIFLIKAFVDFQRARVARNKNAHVMEDSTRLIEIGSFRRSIQQYFWRQIFDAIGRSYQVYDDAVAQILPNAVRSTHIPLSVIELDFDRLRKSPELAMELATQENHLASLTTELAEDENRFRDKAETILTSSVTEQQNQPESRPASRYEQLSSAYDRRLRNWVDARNELAEELLSVRVATFGDTQEIRQLNAMKAILQRVSTVRRIYAAVEIVMPIIFAVGGVVYVWIL